MQVIFLCGLFCKRCTQILVPVDHVFLPYDLIGLLMKYSNARGDNSWHFSDVAS